MSIAKAETSFVFFIGLCIAVSSPASATTSLPPSSVGLSVSVDETTGTYQVASSNPAWTFDGTVGSSLTNVAVAKGTDNIGDYQEIDFRWLGDESLQGAIREYRTKPVIEFAITTPQALAKPLPDFPSFTTFPQNLHALSFRDVAMSFPAFDLEHNGTPWILFDDSADTAVLSAASDFMVAEMHGDGKKMLASGLDSKLAGVPPGFTHRSFLTVGSGIRTTIKAWGNAISANAHRSPETDNADMLVKYLGYWTDNGATYYYNYDKNLGYAGTVLAETKHLQNAGIPIHYLQLDSWWYQKTQISPDGHDGGPKNSNLPLGNWNAYGGTVDYSAAPALFPDGLAAFQKSVGLPLVVHSRWIDPTSPYHQTYKISGVAAVDPKWWDDRTDYLKQSGVITYEQDWLSALYDYSPEMASTLDTGPAFADNMSRATQAHGQTMQYCMPLPRFFLQGANYPNLTTIRTSDDRFDRGKWNDFLYTSMLADAVNIRPFTDVFMSGELGNMTLATLSSGPIGIGDGIGKESSANIFKSVRNDGVIVKPDAPILPLDASIISDVNQEHKPLIASTYTNDGLRTCYVFAGVRNGDGHDVSFSPATLGLTGTVYVYRVSDGVGQKLSASDTYTDTIPQNAIYGSYIVAPVGLSGIGFLGDKGMICGTGRQRILSRSDKPNKLMAGVLFAPGETAVTLHGYASNQPTVTVQGGNAQPVEYDSATGYFSVAVSPNPKSRAQVINGDTVTLIDVTFHEPSDTSNKQVEVEFGVGTDGKPFDIKLKGSSGDPGVDSRIIEAVAQTRFEPRIVNGVPTVSKISHTFIIDGMNND